MYVCSMAVVLNDGLCVKCADAYVRLDDWQMTAWRFMMYSAIICRHSPSMAKRMAGLT